MKPLPPPDRDNKFIGIAEVVGVAIALIVLIVSLFFIHP